MLVAETNNILLTRIGPWKKSMAVLLSFYILNLIFFRGILNLLIFTKLIYMVKKCHSL